MPKLLHPLFFPVICVCFSVPAVYGETKLKNMDRYLTEYLISQGYLNFTYVFLGDQPTLEPEFSFKNVECVFNINRCKVVAENINKKRKIYWFRVHSQELGWQATRTIQAGEEVNASDFVWGITDALTCSNQLASESDLRKNAKSVVRLKAGGSLCKSDLIAIDDVRKDDWVVMTSQSDSFELNIKVKALKAGSVGEHIQVRIPGAASVLSVVVTDKGKVELIP
ncbi:flagellar basal body P-ring formation chaperone FlgA [Vibrio metschnikovii]|uniref:flagellar basal body P-ring formation chaperone FlgA n=1 Tax=Vibrio metschnikovii TaxID=28172 RepID=UPI001C2F4969|nr:flagellar basal body P-ring formation chaperone FlgA [Vibrio metschnikovii]